MKAIIITQCLAAHSPAPPNMPYLPGLCCGRQHAVATLCVPSWQVGGRPKPRSDQLPEKAVLRPAHECSSPTCSEHLHRSGATMQDEAHRSSRNVKPCNATCILQKVGAFSCAQSILWLPPCVEHNYELCWTLGNLDSWLSGLSYPTLCQCFSLRVSHLTSLPAPTFNV
jgi:hypothetical protein